MTQPSDTLPRPQPWHAEARRLRDLDPPTSYTKIAAAVDRSVTTVVRYLCPGYGSRQRAAGLNYYRERAARYHRERYASDPEFRARRIANTRRCQRRRNEKNRLLRIEARRRQLELEAAGLAPIVPRRTYVVHILRDGEHLSPRVEARCRWDARCIVRDTYVGSCRILAAILLPS